MALSWISEGQARAKEESREGGRARGEQKQPAPNPKLLLLVLTSLIRFFLKEIVSGETQTFFARKGKLLSSNYPWEHLAWGRAFRTPPCLNCLRKVWFWGRGRGSKCEKDSKR